ncbi:MAG: HutP family protein [Clostridiales bacterium]|nr:HutP family protein [Clostridiales bacterium]
MEANIEYGSRAVSKAAVSMAMSDSRGDEAAIKSDLIKHGIKAAAVDFGGDFLNAVPKLLERTVVAAKREGVIGSSHAEEGAVAGAAHEAIQQIQTKCAGLNLGGKIGIACNGTHLSVCMFFALGLLNLNDIVIGLGHRAV